MGAVTEIPEPYDLCYCHSGKKYKFCCYQSDKASGVERLTISHQKYLERWKTNAENFRRQNCYTWMALKIQPFQPKRILDIGCGDGSGIIALVSALESARILSLDDNKSCLEYARSRCVSNGLESEFIDRFIVSGEDKKHRISATHSKLRFENQITLIEGDLLWDNELQEFIRAVPKFDAITVWLLGTYDIKKECSNIAHLKAFTMVGEYRLVTHQHIYQLADTILKPGGLIHFVDRSISTDVEKLKELLMAEHSSLSAGTGLALREYDMIDYKEADGTTRITMENRLSLNSVIQDGDPLALISIIAVKS